MSIETSSIVRGLFYDIIYIHKRSPSLIYRFLQKWIKSTIWHTRSDNKGIKNDCLTVTTLKIITDTQFSLVLTFSPAYSEEKFENGSGRLICKKGTCDSSVNL